MTPAPRQPKLLSNEIEDFVQSGLYLGGTGIIEDIAYAYWDYNGKLPPDSEVAVKALFKPIDGSNDGKDETIYWSVGPAKDFAPSGDGGSVFSVGNAEGVRNSSNWYHVGKALRDNCGLEKGKLSGPAGIKVLIGTQLTIVRKDQPQREGMEKGALIPQQPGQPGQQERKPTFLIPTSAVFPWDKSGGRRAPAQFLAPKPATAQATAAPAPAPISSPAPVPVVQAQPAGPQAPVAPAAPPPPIPINNGNAVADVHGLIGEVLGELLASNGNVVEFAAIPMSMTEKLGPQGRGVTVPARIEIMKQVKDPVYLASLAKQRGWSFDGTYLYLAIV